MGVVESLQGLFVCVHDPARYRQHDAKVPTLRGGGVVHVVLGRG